MNLRLDELDMSTTILGPSHVKKEEAKENERQGGLTTSCGVTKFFSWWQSWAIAVKRAAKGTDLFELQHDPLCLFMSRQISYEKATVGAVEVLTAEVCGRELKWMHWRFTLANVSNRSHRGAGAEAEVSWGINGSVKGFFGGEVTPHLVQIGGLRPKSALLKAPP